MAHRSRRFVTSCIMLALAATLSGCAYMADRGNDALDIMDFGLLVNDEVEPGIALYFDFFNVVPVGGAYVDSKLLGWANRHAGWIDYEQKSWGALLIGEEKYGGGQFDATDFRQARADQADLTERPTFDVGVIGVTGDGETPPPITYAECQRVIHLGWVGVLLNLRPADLLDFVLGWTTLDIMGDDAASQSDA